VVDVALCPFEYVLSLEDIVAHAVSYMVAPHNGDYSLEKASAVPRCEDLFAHVESRVVLSDVSSASLLWPAPTYRALITGGSPVDRPFVQLSFRECGILVNVVSSLPRCAVSTFVRDLGCAALRYLGCNLELTDMESDILPPGVYSVPKIVSHHKSADKVLPCYTWPLDCLQWKFMERKSLARKESTKMRSPQQMSLDLHDSKLTSGEETVCQQTADARSEPKATKRRRLTPG